MGVHSHSVEPENAEKQKAYEETFTMELKEPVIAKFPAIEHTKKTIQNQRRKALPPLPSTLETLDIPEEVQRINLGGEDLSMVAADSGKESGDQRTIIFAIQPHLDYLSKCDTLICDGTFDPVPLLTYQLYTIHGLIGDIASPLLHGLLPTKQTSTYDSLIQMVKKISPDLNPTLILTDFEKAAVNAFTKAFPLAKLGGCRFHLAKAITRNVNEHGFKQVRK